MRGFQMKIEGNWGHFKRPETNNNPLSHDFITKTALIGLIGAVLGEERQAMKTLFPQLSEDLLYSVKLLNSVKKVSWGFTSHTAINPTGSGSPKYFEFLKTPKFQVAIAIQNERSWSLFERFLLAVKQEESIYTPVLGWHNCPANLYFDSEGTFGGAEAGVFEAECFVEKGKHRLKNFRGSARIGFDQIPTYQNEDFWNLPKYYKSMIYPDANGKLEVEGIFHQYSINEEKWYLI